MSNASSEPNVRLTVPWRAWLGVLVAVAIFYGSQIAAGLWLGIYAGVFLDMTKSQVLEWVKTVPAQFAYMLLAQALVIGAVYWFVRRYQNGLASIGLRRPGWSDPLYGLAAVPVYLVLYLITLVIFTHLIPGLDINQQQQLGFDQVSGGGQLAMTFISLVILPPLAEELLVRGLLYSTLKKVLPIAAAVILTSLAFAAAHLPEGGAAGPLYVAAIDTFVLSLVLIYLREKTDGLWACMTLHAIKNGVAFVALFVLHLS